MSIDTKRLVWNKAKAAAIVAAAPTAPISPPSVNPISLPAAAATGTIPTVFEQTHEPDVANPGDLWIVPGTEPISILGAIHTGTEEPLEAKPGILWVLP